MINKFQTYIGTSCWYGGKREGVIDVGGSRSTRRKVIHVPHHVQPQSQRCEASALYTALLRSLSCTDKKNQWSPFEHKLLLMHFSISKGIRFFNFYHFCTISADDELSFEKMIYSKTYYVYLGFFKQCTCLSLTNVNLLIPIYFFKSCRFSLFARK